MMMMMMIHIGGLLGREVLRGGGERREREKGKEVGWFMGSYSRCTQ